MANSTILIRYIDTDFNFRMAFITLEGKTTYYPIYKKLEQLDYKPKKIISWRVIKNYINSQSEKSKPTQAYIPALLTKTKQLN